jgi:hypothetical protein
MNGLLYKSKTLLSWLLSSKPLLNHHGPWWLTFTFSAMMMSFMIISSLIMWSLKPAGVYSTFNPKFIHFSKKSISSFSNGQTIKQTRMPLREMVFLPNNNRIVQIQGVVTICASYHVQSMYGSFAKITLPV